MQGFGRSDTQRSLELIKLEKGLGAGDVLHHALMKKTTEEAAALKARKEGESALKQETNVERERKDAQEKLEAKRKPGHYTVGVTTLSESWF
jgi:hypothetical protein